MALNLFFSIALFLLFSFTVTYASNIDGCRVGEPDCFEFNNLKDRTVDHVMEKDDDELYWKIFCFKGLAESVIFLWVNPVMKLNFSHVPSHFKTVRGITVQEVKDQRDSFSPVYSVLQKLRLVVQREVEEVPFIAFNQSCIGVQSDTPFTAKFLIKNLEPWLLASLGFGIILFLSAGSWSHNVKLHYGFGVGVGVMASLLIVAFVLSRMFPQSLKKLGYVLMAIGCSTYMYLWTYIVQHFYETSSTLFGLYWQWIVGYVLVSALISFALCYRYGPLTEPRTLNLIKWCLQLISLVFIYNGTQIREASVAIIVTLITLYNLPAGLFDNRFTRYIRYKIFKPKIKLLTEQEYQEQGFEETKKALEELRSFCQSPECNKWKTISSLSNPRRFADFVEGRSWHVTDDELLEYDSGPDVTPVTDEDSDQETQNVNVENSSPDSSQGLVPEIDSEEEDRGETSDQSIDGPPLS
ncbi:nuclear envelope integral membrane protein 1-like [Saccostrea echinata]|uniref:nuclear envelope integral membrane protein 1-like n=1 Tax=Saccostrea echinata TaxID=191078 RepID=UPI002A816B9C|nr:nuclear envelope integral membrane protein 1-like [Saccostrea echinata]